MQDYKKRVGYACINMTLGKTGVTTNRDCILKTLNAKGLPYISKLTLANVIDLEKIVKWNHENGFMFYRISSGLFPWKTRYEFEELPDWLEIQAVLKRIGNFVTEVGQRLEFHPSHFTILASPNPKTVEVSLKDLEQHSRIFDEMGLAPSYWNCLNIHVGGAYGDKISATKRWCENFQRLSESCQRRVVVENDDKANMYSVHDLYYMIHLKTGTPITFDIFHHTFCTGGLSSYEAANLAATTWGKVPMVIHWSSSMKNYELPTAKSVAHANYIYDEFNDWDTNGWFMCESKAKELSILEYLQDGPRAQTLLTECKVLETI
jgi:UV DNA damage endonuclease